MDVVFNLINVKKFCRYSYEEKIALKERGRPLPDLSIDTVAVSRGKTYTRKFSKEIYTRNIWICGCNKKNAMYCFPCLLFNGDRAWTDVGVTDLVHLGDKIKKHSNSKTHLHNAIELALLGTTDIRSQLSSAYWKNVQKHNENVTKNRYVLSKIINCIKFCGAFELALRGHDESDTSQNPGIFRGLINFAAELDSTLSEHLNKASVFKGTSKEIQNELLDCILEVCHEEINKEVKKASFLAVMADETTDVTSKTQLVVILRYIRDDGEPIERFWTYLNPKKCDAETLSTNILSIIDPLIENSPNKLIAQSYDGAAVMSGQHAGVQAKIKQKYPFAHFVHCYAHQLNLIMSKAASVNAQVRVFFGNLQDIPGFFSNSPQRVEVLNKIVSRKIPHGSTTRWNFNIRTINVVFENRESLIECMEEIVENFTQTTVCSAANSIRRTLQDPVFVFWLTFFHHVMPHVDILFNQLQKRKTDPTEVKHNLNKFEESIVHIRNTIDEIVNEGLNMVCSELSSKRKRPGNSRLDNRVAALEVCDNITNSIQDRFIFKDHLIAASLFFSEQFVDYCGKFPEDKLTTICSIYPTLEKQQLRTELSVIFSRSDCREMKGALPFLKFLINNNLETTMRETKKLLEIVVTTPMTTAEAERCFSTLKRIKTFLRNTMSEDRLIALSMISIEKKFISEIEKFNEKVIEKFATRKERRIELIYKK